MAALKTGASIPPTLKMGEIKLQIRQPMQISNLAMVLARMLGLDFGLRSPLTTSLRHRLNLGQHLVQCCIGLLDMSCHGVPGSISILLSDALINPSMGL